MLLFVLLNFIDFCRRWWLESVTHSSEGRKKPKKANESMARNLCFPWPNTTAAELRRSIWLKVATPLDTGFDMEVFFIPFSSKVIRELSRLSFMFLLLQ